MVNAYQGQLNGTQGRNPIRQPEISLRPKNASRVETHSMIKFPSRQHPKSMPLLSVFCLHYGTINKSDLRPVNQDETPL